MSANLYKTIGDDSNDLNWDEMKVVFRTTQIELSTSTGRFEVVLTKRRTRVAYFYLENGAQIWRRQL